MTSRSRPASNVLPTYTHPHVLVIDVVGDLSYGPDGANERRWRSLTIWNKKSRIPSTVKETHGLTDCRTSCYRIVPRVVGAEVLSLQPHCSG